MCDRFVSLEEAAPLLVDADLLLWRRPSLIAVAGRGRHSHAGMAALWWGEWMVLEVREFVGGRAVTLQSQVDKYPGRIDVFRPCDQVHGLDLYEAARQMVKQAGCRYGWARLVAVACLHLPVVRLFVRAPMSDKDPADGVPFCSDAVSRAYRLAGFDPVPNLADRATEPADLARSPFFRYLFTLVP